jgi:hypothetical protein
MCITIYPHIDQVRRTPEGDISVPINAAYNHHFDGILNNGKKVRLKENVYNYTSTYFSYQVRNPS